MTSLDERYGRGRVASRGRIRTRWTIGIAALTLAVAGLWVFSNSDGSSDVQVQDTGHTIVDETTVSVRYSVTAPPGTRITCAIEALDRAYGIVGWREVTFDGASGHSNTYETEVKTVMPAANGLVSQCWSS